MRYRYELVHGDDADFIAYQRNLGKDRWQTVAAWMIPGTGHPAKGRKAR